jgi:hypothetical protein
VYATGCYDDYGKLIYCDDWHGFALAPPSYVLNPNAGVTLTSIKTVFTYQNMGPGAFVDSSQLTGEYYYHQDWCSDYYNYNYLCHETLYGAWPQAVGLELNFHINSPTLYADQDFVVYKVYPYSTTYLYP